MAIVIERTITVKNDTSVLDNPLYLYVGDGDITCLFAINEIKKAAKFGSISPNNLITEGVSYGEIRIYKPDGSLVFTNRAEVIDDRLQAVISFENLNDYTEAGIHQLQIHLYDESDGDRNRFTIPPVFLNVLLPIGSESSVIDNAYVGYALLDSRGIDEPTFLEDGSYNKTVWATGDIITKNKINKVEDALSILVDGNNESLEALNGFKLWCGTREQYNAISDKDSMTLYFVKEE